IRPTHIDPGTLIFATAVLQIQHWVTGGSIGVIAWRSVHKDEKVYLDWSSSEHRLIVVIVGLRCGKALGASGQAGRRYASFRKRSHSETSCRGSCRLLHPANVAETKTCPHFILRALHKSIIIVAGARSCERDSAGSHLAMGRFPARSN